MRTAHTTARSNRAATNGTRPIVGVEGCRFAVERHRDGQLRDVLLVAQADGEPPITRMATEEHAVKMEKFVAAWHRLREGRTFGIHLYLGGGGRGIRFERLRGLSGEPEALRLRVCGRHGVAELEEVFDGEESLDALEAAFEEASRFLAGARPR
jgi:hypothetical protein